MAPTILIKFCGFRVHSKPNNMTLSVFPGKIPETRKIVFNFLSVAQREIFRISWPKLDFQNFKIHVSLCYDFEAKTCLHPFLTEINFFCLYLGVCSVACLCLYVELITLHPATQSVSECAFIKTCIKYYEHLIDFYIFFLRWEQVESLLNPCVYSINFC